MRACILIVVAIVIGGCATAYKPEGFSGGYSSMRLDENVFQVTFKGNGYTGRSRSNDFALLRSAEIALENGYGYFVMVDTEKDSRKSSYTTPTTATTNMNGIASGNSISGTATTTFSGGQTIAFVKPSTSNTILCFKEKPDGFSYNAEFVAKSIKEKYDIHETGK